MAGNPVHWFEIYVQDMGRAQAFYEAVLGMTLDALPTPASEAGIEMRAFPMAMGAAGTGGALVRAPGVPSGGNSTLVYFSCEDCAVEASRVVKSGGRLEREKMAIGEYGHIALAYDSEGNLFGLHSLK
ncbi:MAG: VOC family protein [Lysobacterales bacterium]|nr:MAG: VOC family protein [Xanthomonadales bacterium]